MFVWGWDGLTLEGALVPQSGGAGGVFRGGDHGRGAVDAVEGAGAAGEGVADLEGEDAVWRQYQ